MAQDYMSPYNREGEISPAARLGGALITVAIFGGIIWRALPSLQVGIETRARETAIRSCLMKAGHYPQFVDAAGLVTFARIGGKSTRLDFTQKPAVQNDGGQSLSYEQLRNADEQRRFSAVAACLQLK